jgi:transcriptional regulator with XRE-family HTH domain
MKLEENIKKLRKRKNWSQTELAAQIGTHLSHINRIETGKYRPSLPVLIKLAEALEVSLDVLVNGGEDNIKEVKIEDKSLAQRVKLMDTLDEEDKKALVRVIDSMLTKKKIYQFITQKQELEV